MNAVLKRQYSTHKVIGFSDVVEKAVYVFGSREKAYAWYMNKNPRYGNLSPFQFCKIGNVNKVFKDLCKSLI